MFVNNLKKNLQWLKKNVELKTSFPSYFCFKKNKSSFIIRLEYKYVIVTRQK